MLQTTQTAHFISFAKKEKMKFKNGLNEHEDDSGLFSHENDALFIMITD